MDAHEVLSYCLGRCFAAPSIRATIRPRSYHHRLCIRIRIRRSSPPLLIPRAEGCPFLF